MYFMLQARRPMMKPSEAARMSDARFPDSTGYRDSYIKHPMEKKFAHQPEVYKAPAAAFDGVTTFQRDFKGPIGERTVSFKPNNQAFSSGQPLEDVTTNRNDFRKWPMEKPFIHLQEGYKRPDGIMETSTTHNATYKEFPIQRAIGKRPTSATKTKNVPFDGNTSYSTDYRKWDMGNREKAMMRDEYPIFMMASDLTASFVHKLSLSPLFLMLTTAPHISSLNSSKDSPIKQRS